MLIYGQPMKAVYNLRKQIKIRLSILLSLIFFVLFTTACRQNSKETIDIIWKDKKPIGVSVPKSLLKKTDSFPVLLKIRLENQSDLMLGEYIEQSDHILFKPLLPLSHGLSYEVYFSEEFLDKVTVPTMDAGEASKLVAIYPSADTVPENLLKIYLRFSAPMREGEALEHINLTNSSGDTLYGTFLDLRPELWNKERTVLTLWLDPGRIKRDLVPNQELGNPLKNGSQYVVNVSDRWKDANNLALPKNYSKRIVVTSRDSLSPHPQQWKIDLPSSGTVEPLTINTNEALDYFLLGETIKVLNDKDILIAGSLKISNQEKIVRFIPDSPWLPGIYSIRIASYLEDLAGNNLQRPFDRDVQAGLKLKEQEFTDRKFTINLNE